MEDLVNFSTDLDRVLHVVPLLKRLHVRAKGNRFCSLLLFEVGEVNRFLEICFRDPRKIVQASRNSILEP